MYIQNTHFGDQISLRCGHIDGKHNSGNHLHQYFELVFILDGEIEINVDGTEYLAKSGDIAVITPFSTHSFFTPKYVKQIICTFPNSLISDFLPFSELCKKRLCNVFHPSDHLWDFILKSKFCETVRTFHNFDLAKDFNYLNKIKSTFYLVLTEFFAEVAENDSYKVDNALSKILIYVSENYDKDISLNTVGTKLGYSPKYVSACFSAIPGHNFRSIINSLRIEKAKKLLTSTDKHITELKYECGFSSQASFHRIFRETVGMSPQKYRAKNTSKSTEIKNTLQ